MTDSPLSVAYLTAGAGGMYCGSCMHDNTLSRALIARGVDVQLIPLYTPIRTDEDDVSVDRVFFGGINVFLQQKIPLFRHLPAMIDRMFDARWLLRWATSRAAETSPKVLGGLAVSMLKGTSGYQRKEVRKLCDWLSTSVKPQLVDLSNMLIAGCVPEIKRSLGVPVLVTLQGDDIFLDEMIEPYRSSAFDEIRRLVDDVDGFIVNSRFYADYMADYFSIPPDKFHIVPLGIDTAGFPRHTEIENQTSTHNRPPTIGYLARLAPEKGLHILVDAFMQLRELSGMENARLRVAGWLGEQNRKYAEEQFAKLRAAGLGDAFQYAGEVDRAGKIEFLTQIDVLSVPSLYRDPKGLYVLEALAAGVPVVQPEHGAFPELLDALAGGRLVRAEDPQALAEQLHALLSNQTLRGEMGRKGQAAVHDRFNADQMAIAMLETYRRFVGE